MVQGFVIGIADNKRTDGVRAHPGFLLRPLIALAILLGAFSLSSASTAAAVLSWGGQTGLGEDALAENPWRAVAIGEHHTLALTPEGAVRAWGENYYGQCDVPLEGGFTGIAAGLYHSLSLRRDGSIAVWGDNTRGQCRAATVGLAAVSCVFFLLRRVIRKWLVDRRQRQEMQEDLFWNLLLRGDQPQPLSKG